MNQRGLSLIVVMLILIVVSVLGVGGIQISMMGERSTRNERDMQVAWQGAEAGLIDAEFDIEGLPVASTNKRNTIFKRGDVDLAKFIDLCKKSSKLLVRVEAGDYSHTVTIDLTNFTKVYDIYAKNRPTKK